MGRKHIAAAVLFAAACFLFGRPAYAADDPIAAYRKPFLSGFTKTWIYEGESWDAKSSISRIFADDQEDGDLTKQIRSEGTVDTGTPGTYTIRCSVTDSDQRVSRLTQEVAVVARGSTEAKLVQRTLYTLPPASHFEGVSFMRGYNHDRQSLGVWLDPGGTLKIRLVNSEAFGKELSIGFYNDDNQKDTESTRRLTDAFVALQNEHDYASVPFVSTPHGTDVQPVLEFEWTQGMHEIPYYRYGDDEAGFFAKWNAAEAPYAIIEGSAATFLAPLRDKDKIINYPNAGRAAYRFAKIDEMLEWYADVMRQYDEYAGLDFYAGQPYNQNIRAKYFVKPDKSGPIGSAAYYGGSMSAYTGDSLSGYLFRSWVVLHEFAHGYEGSIARQENAFGETTNNILAHYFESTYRLEDDFGWLLDTSGATKAQRIASLEQYARRIRGETAEFNEIAGRKEFRASLFMFINALDRLGPKETMARLHSRYRKYYAEHGKNRNSSDAVIEAFSDGGYNMMPYFASYHIVPSETAAHRIWHQDYPILYYLHDLIPDDALAAQAKEHLGLSGADSLVTADDLAYTGYTGTVRLRIAIDDLDQIRGKNIIIKNGSRVVAELPVTGAQIETKLPVGAYEAELPVPKDLSYSYENVCILVPKGGAAEAQQLTYQKIEREVLLDDTKILFGGLGDGTFASIAFDAEAGKLFWHVNAGQPHSYFKEQYASFRVLNAQGEEIYRKTMGGEENLSALDQEITFLPGYKLAIQHKEIFRLRVMSLCADAKKPGYALSGTDEKIFVWSDQGLVLEAWDAGQREDAYLSCLNQYTQAAAGYIEKPFLKRPDWYHQEKTVIENAYARLSAAAQASYRSKWPMLFEDEGRIFVYQPILPFGLSAVADSAADGEVGAENVDGPAVNAIDCNPNTYWHSNWKDAAQAVDLAADKNNNFTILLDENMDIGKIAYLPRQGTSGAQNGRILSFRLFFASSETGEDFQEITPCSPSSWANDASLKETEFEAVNARRLRIQAAGTAGDKRNLISAAEFYLYEKAALPFGAQDLFLSGLSDVKAEGGAVPQANQNGGVDLSAGTTAVYNIEGRGFDIFSAAVRVAGQVQDGPARLQIYGDDALLYDSGQVQGQSAEREIYLPVDGIRQLKLAAAGSAGLFVSLQDAQFYLTEEKDSIQLLAGETARVTPNRSVLALFREGRWQSSDPSVAAVDAAGNITAAGEGNAKIHLFSAGAKEPEKSFSVSVAKKQQMPQEPDTSGGQQTPQEPDTPDKIQQPNPPVTQKTEEVQPLPEAQKPQRAVLAKVKKAGTKLLVQWKKTERADGYEVWVKQKGAFQKAKTAGAGKTSVKISKMQKGKKYRIKVRAYCKDAAGKLLYGAFSKIKTMKM